MSIRIELELASGEFTTRMIHAGETVRQFQNNVGQAVTSINRLTESSTSFLGAVRDITVTLGLARAAFENVKSVTTGWAGEIVKVNAEMERLQYLLAGMSRAANPMKEAADQVKYLRDFAKDAPFSLGALSDTFVKMKATGLDPMKGALKGLTDGIAAFGGTDETLKRATIAITQMSGKGVIQMEELRQQLGEAMPRAVEIMARSMGVSMGQLIQDISKGTLDAKSSLAAFNLELDRTFGGAAAAQMNTFNGMIARSKTLMQNLALEIGNAGFFSSVKDQLKQINDALAGEGLKSMSTSLGRGLATVVTGLGDAVRWVVQFRGEIMAAGEAMLWVFGAGIAGKAVLGLLAGLQSVRAEMALVGVQISMLRAGFTGFGTAVASVNSIGTAFSAAALGGRALVGLMPILLSGLTMVSAWVIPLTMAVGALAFAFQRTADKTQEAFDQLVKYGAESRKQVSDAEAYVETLRQRVLLLEKLKKEQDEGTEFGVGGVSIADADIANAREAYSRAQLQLMNERARGGEKDREKLLSAENEAQVERMQKLRANYDQETIERANQYTDKLKALNDANKDTSKLTDEYQAARRAAQLAFYKVEQDDLSAQLIDLQMRVDRGNDPDAILIREKRNQQLMRGLAEVSQKIAEQSALDLKPKQLDKGVNVDKLLEQAKTKLDGLNSELATQRAELQGISGEYARIAFLIQDAVAKSNGVWTSDNEKVRAVINSLKEAQGESDKLSEMITGKKQFDSDVLALYQKAQQEFAEAAAGDKTGFEAILAKMKAGVYGGQSPIARLASGLGGVGEAAKAAGKEMEGAFGAGITDKGQSLVDVVDKLANSWFRLKNGVMGVTSIGGGITGDQRSMSLETSTYQPGSTYMRNLVNTESGGRADARASTSSAVGLTQFVEETWLQFLKEMRPDILSRGRAAALETRTNPELSMQAGAWYAAQNARKLEGAGVEANDANVYLAHFLGPGGAIAALRQSSDTLIAAIPELRAARAANPGVFNNVQTVGDLQKWSQNKFGTGTTFSRMGGDTSAFAELLERADPPTRKLLLTTQELMDKTTDLKQKNALAEWAKNATLETNKADDNTDGLNKRLASLRKTISEGAFGDRNPDADRYKELIDLAKKWDASELAAQERKKSRAKTDSILESLPRRQEVLDEKDEDLNRRLEDESKFKFSASYYTELRRTLMEIKALQKDIEFNPGNAERNKGAIAMLDAQLAQRRDQEVANTVAVEQQRTIAVERGLMTADQARDDAHRREIRRLEEFLELYAAGGEKRMMIEAQLARSKAAYDRQVLAASPIGRQMKEWSDYSNNLQRATVGWLDSGIDKLAEFAATGKANFADLAASISKDMLKIGMKGVLGMMFNPAGGGAGKFGGGSGKMVAQHHSGGMAGSVASSRMVDPSMFLGAKRWHTGTFGQTLGGDEIPIIAKRGEQVDWPENLAKQYGGSTIAPTIAVTVQGSPGQSPSDHQKMGEVIGKAAMDKVREMMVKEIRQQQRPGGILRG